LQKPRATRSRHDIGVSASTASWVLKWVRSVIEGTRREVRTAICKFNYRSSVAHRDQGRPGCLGSAFRLGQKVRAVRLPAHRSAVRENPPCSHWLYQSGLERAHADADVAVNPNLTRKCN
jgi:hypothetical protein